MVVPVERSGEGAESVSTLRLYVMRVLYLLNFLLLGSDVWPHLVRPGEPIAPMDGVGWSFWATLSLLSALGLRYPLKMLPLFFTQFCYKAIWLMAVALPLRQAGEWTPAAQQMAWVFMIGAALDLIATPWPYVWRNYVRAPGDTWRLALPVRVRH